MGTASVGEGPSCLSYLGEHRRTGVLRRDVRCFARQWAGARFLRDLDVVKEHYEQRAGQVADRGAVAPVWVVAEKITEKQVTEIAGVNSGAEDRARDMLTATADYLDSLEMEVRQLRSMSMQHGFEVPPSQLEKKEGYSLIDEAEEPYCLVKMMVYIQRR